MPNKIVSRETAELVSVEHHCLPGGGRTYQSHTDTGELRKGELYWGDGSYYCTSCGEKLPQNISEVEEQL